MPPPPKRPPRQPLTLIPPARIPTRPAFVDPRHTYAWQKLRGQVIKAARLKGLPCAYPPCGKPIDYTLSGRTPPGPSVDHVNPIWLGGPALPPASDLVVMHLKCNVERGNRMRATSPKPEPTRYRNPRY